MLGYLFKLLEIFIILLLATPFTGLVLLPLTCVYILIQVTVSPESYLWGSVDALLEMITFHGSGLQSFYVSSSCQLRRLEAVSRSPIYSHFNETVQGASVIRAFGEQQRFILHANHRIDGNQEAYFPRFVATRFIQTTWNKLEYFNNTHDFDRVNIYLYLKLCWWFSRYLIYVYCIVPFVNEMCQALRWFLQNINPLRKNINNNFIVFKMCRFFCVIKCVSFRWLAVNLEFLGNVLVLAAAILSVRGRDELSPGIVGLAVTHSLQVTNCLV